MLSPTDETQDAAPETDVYPHARTLSWMASLAVAGGDLRTAEGYLLELLSICVFAERTVDHHSD
jgi:hypothetical protein